MEVSWKRYSGGDRLSVEDNYSTLVVTVKNGDVETAFTVDRNEFRAAIKAIGQAPA